MDVPAPDGLAERVRLDPGPVGRRLPPRPGRDPRPGRPPVPARDDGAGDQLGHPDRVAGGARRADDGSLAPRERAVPHPPPDADRLRRRPRAAAHHPLRHRRGPGHVRVRAGLRLRPLPGDLVLHRPGLRAGDLPPGPRRPRGPADPDHRHAAGVRGRPGHGPDPDAGRRGPLLRPVLDRPRAPVHLPGGTPAAAVDRPPLAALAGPGPFPGSSVEPVPAAQRADPEGPHVRAQRGHGGGGDHVAAGGAARRAQLGLPLLLAARLGVHPVEPVRARLRLGGGRFLLVSRRPGPARRRGPGGLRGRRRAGPERADSGSSQRVRRRAAGAGGQRGLHPAPARRLGHHAAGHPHPAGQLAAAR